MVPCPKCNKRQTVHKRPTQNTIGIMRFRECSLCGHGFYSIEVPYGPALARVLHKFFGKISGS